MAMEPPFRRMKLLGKRIFMTHGHLYGVKQGLHGLQFQVKDQPADLVLYGHTHCPQLVEEENCLYLCPGSMGHHDEHYAVIELKENVEKMDIALRRL